MVFNSEYLISKGNDRVMRTYKGQLERGDIKDRNGKDLAISIPVKSISVNRVDFHKNKGLEQTEVLKEVARVLEMQYEDLLKRIGSEEQKGIVFLARQIDKVSADFIKNLKIPGFIISDELRRFYPTGEINAHLIGKTNIDGVGAYGIEKIYDEEMRSTPARKRIIKDKQGHIIKDLGLVSDGKPAKDIVLSIDERIQEQAYKALKYTREINQATSASLVLIDAKTGEILALANSPSYNPNRRDKIPFYITRNRVVTDLYEPGSTTKPLIALGALKRKYVNWSEVFDTKPFLVNGKNISDSHYMAKGNLFDIIKYSSNTGMVHIALRMQPKEIIDTLESFGYGKRTNLSLVGENPGRLPKGRKVWSKIEQATVGYGYGFMVNPLQIAQAYTILANHGVKKPLSILKVEEEPKGELVADPKDVDRMLQALEAVVEGGGTGAKAMVTGYRIGGKTGTSKVAVAGKYGKDYVGTFAGIAPMSNPRFVMVVIVNEPHAGVFYGGEVAVPVFSEVMQTTLQLYNIPPDDIDENNKVRTLEDKRARIRAQMNKKN
ncbi:MAG: penicillin-binding transpeptidase domain-containing protein [Succinivibrionaceae bacterium]|nr:penicillin-binding transpeptidase domain-containing protein [Succinivibrionaceae bacterium]